MCDYTHSFFHIVLHHVISLVIRYSSMCYTARSHFLSIPNAILCNILLTPNSQSIPLPVHPPQQPQVCSQRILDFKIKLCRTYLGLDILQNTWGFRVYTCVRWKPFCNNVGYGSAGGRNFRPKGEFWILYLLGQFWTTIS